MRTKPLIGLNLGLERRPSCSILRVFPYCDSWLPSTSKAAN